MNNASSSFLDNKNLFFESKNLNRSPISTMDEVDERFFPQNVSIPFRYQFMLENSHSLDLELEQLYKVLKDLKDFNEEEEGHKQFWLYCYYCCKMMRAFLHAYGKSDDKYAKLEKEIRANIEGVQKGKKAVDNFFVMIWKKIKEDLKSFIWPASEIRKNVGVLNMYRIQWTFLRITVSGAFNYLRGIQILELFEQLLSRPINEEQFIRNMQAVSPIMNMLSVGFFAIKILINTGSLIKHTFYPSKEAKDGSASVFDRLFFELSKRFTSYLNDIPWMLINGLTNYAEFFHIAAPIADGLVVGFLFYDFLQVVIQYALKQKDYLIKKKEYEDQIDQLLEAEAKDSDGLKLEMLQRQLDEHNLAWKVQGEIAWFNALAAFVFLAGYSVTILFSGPLVGLIAYAFCVLSVAIYLSEDAFETYRKNVYREKQLNDRQISKDNPLQEAHLKMLEKAQLDTQIALNNLILSLVGKTVIPTLTIALIAISWEAAVIVFAAYYVFHLGLHWSRQSTSNNAPFPDDLEINERPSGAPSSSSSTSSTLSSSSFPSPNQLRKNSAKIIVLPPTSEHNGPEGSRYTFDFGSKLGQSAGNDMFQSIHKVS